MCIVYNVNVNFMLVQSTAKPNLDEYMFIDL